MALRPIRSVLLWWIAFCLAISVSAFAAPPTSTPRVFSNPVIAGFAPDPSIVRVGRDFYLVTSSFETFPALPIYHSRNLALAKLLADKGLDVYVADPILSEEDVRGKGLRYLKAVDADLVFDPFELKFEVSGRTTRSGALP